MNDYRIVAHEITVPQTDEWNPRPVKGTVYRVVGPGVDRPATDIEIAVWKQGSGGEEFGSKPSVISGSFALYKKI